MGDEAAGAGTDVDPPGPLARRLGVDNLHEAACDLASRAAFFAPIGHVFAGVDRAGARNRQQPQMDANNPDASSYNDLRSSAFGGGSLFSLSGQGTVPFFPSPVRIPVTPAVCPVQGGEGRAAWKPLDGPSENLKSFDLF